MRFEDHLEANRNDDGTYDLAAAVDARIKEILEHPGDIEALARKTAQQERHNWEARETDRLRKQFTQPALSEELEEDAYVPLGDNAAAALGDMNTQRIVLRKDLRTKSHLREIRAFETEMTYWYNTEELLDPGETISDAINRYRSDG